MAKKTSNRKKPKKIAKAAPELPVSSALLPAEAPEENLPEELQAAATEETAPEARKLLTLLGPWLAGLAAFLFGLIFFLPLSAIAMEALGFLQNQGFNIQSRDMSVSMFGSIEMDKPAVSVSSGESPFHVDADILTGKVSLWSLLFGGRLKTSLQILQPSYQPGSLKIAGGVWNLEADIENIREADAKWKGDVSLKADNIRVNYDEALPFLNEKIAALITDADVKMTLSRQNWVIKPGGLKIISTMADITAQGSINPSGAGNLNLQVEINPKGKLEQIINENRAMLEGFNMKYMLEKPIRLQITGPMDKPNFVPVQGQNPGQTPGQTP